MNFQQLRIIREAIRCNFNLTAVSEALYTLQSGVSKHIRDLEEELGVELFIRKGKRLLGLTEPGREMAAIAERLPLSFWCASSRRKPSGPSAASYAGKVTWTKCAAIDDPR